MANKATVQANGAANGNGKGQPKLSVKPKKGFVTPDAANESGAAGEKVPAA